MDDRVDDRSFAARVATLPSHEELMRRIALRKEQHLAFVVRADRWANTRTDAEPGVVFPRDEAAVLALGVPCDDCLVLIYAQGQSGHVVRFEWWSGRHWAALISAQCGRPFVVEDAGGTGDGVVVADQAGVRRWDVP